MVRRAFPWLYSVWIVVCVVLFFALRGMEDPSRPTGRILSIEAGQRALTIARERGLREHEVVHVARARKGEGAPEDRWVVLLDRKPRTGLREAIVIEVRASDGAFLRIRKPER